MDEASEALRMIAADTPDRGRMYYLINGNNDFIPDAKEFLDWEAATNRAPGTMKAYCSRLLWYYRFLVQRKLDILEATPADLLDMNRSIGDTEHTCLLERKGLILPSQKGTFLSLLATG